MMAARIAVTVVLATALCSACSVDRSGKPSSAPSGHTGRAQRSAAVPSTQASTAPTAAPSAATTTTEQWGIAMPPATRRVHAQEKPGFHGEANSAVWLASEASVEDAGAHFAKQPGAEKPYTLSGYASCVDIGNTRVCVAAADTMPRTMGAPTRPIAAQAPPNTKSWITMYRQGKPPPCPPCSPGAKGTTKPGCNCP
jgi:glucose/arabinose dehydrogenase